MTTLKKLAAGLVAFTALTAVTSAPAANIYTYPDKPTDDGFYFVSVEGKIVPGDDAKFEKVLADKGVKDAIVWLNGPGGEMFAGLAIGRSVKRHNLSTFVPDKAMCVSMCALIWVAGFNRYYEEHARIGFHSMADVYTDKRGQVVNKTASNGGNALVGAYLSSLGLSDKAIYYMTSAQPKDLLWMNVRIAANIDLTITNWKQERGEVATRVPVERSVPFKSQPAVPPWPGEMVAAADPAIENLDQAIAANPNDATALSKRGQLYVLRGNFPAAIRDFSEVLRLRPKDPEGLNNRCWAHAILGDLQAALRDCNEALQIRPRYADAYDSRGFINLKIGQPDNAVADYDAALRINPKQASSLYGRGMAKLKTGNSDGALQDISAAKSLQANIAEEFAGFGIR